MLILNFTFLALVLVNSYVNAQTSSCLQCSSDDSGCDEGTVAPTNCPTPNDSCYSLTLSGGFILERGCLGTLSDEEQARCVDPTDRSCTVCSEPGYNRARWPACHQCSKSSNSKCAFHPNRIAFCRNYMEDDRCYAQVVGDDVIRGCQSDLPENEDPCKRNKYCITCSDGDACNGADQDVLKTVTRCVQCKEGDFRCIDGTTTNSECDEREDRCYIKMWREGELDRGCVKKLNQEEQQRCNDESDRSCYSCSGRQCNNHRWLRCFHCAPGQNATCAEEQTNAILSYYCGSFDLGDRCYSKLVNFEVTRGCASDLGVNVDPCKGVDTCVSCSSDGCNSISEAYIKYAGEVKRGSIIQNIQKTI
ncbi:uncharacterized protein LOC5567193 isoform X1 [Aedes aegypti]|uniref:DUF753 domain-containing protein n=1 Tax=Aedes aegypti TaxID=7159 RepID=A0A6I8T418_AEDAE|nr:uncharacterized protein LOC5567193 isoform X1 [Aedes aegypti]